MGQPRGLAPLFLQKIATQHKSLLFLAFKTIITQTKILWIHDYSTLT